MKHTICIMAGGGGTRLYPLSQTEEGKLPKQFLSVIKGPTLLQKAIARIPEAYDVTVIPEERYGKTVLLQAKAIDRSVELIEEPFGCNTAAAILYTAALQEDSQRVLCFIPADHEMDTAVFRDLLARAVTTAEKEDRMVTIGIQPTKPETNYGYIKIANDQEERTVCEVERFVEKPDKEKATAYLADGGYYWNAGIFAAKASVFIESAKAVCPDLLNPLLSAADRSDPMTQVDAYTSLKRSNLNKSIDYALLEKIADSILLIPAPVELLWNDLGNWESLRTYMDIDSNDNAEFDNSVTFEASNSVTVCNYTDLPVVVRGIEKMLVVVTDQGILVRPIDEDD